MRALLFTLLLLLPATYVQVLGQCTNGVCPTGYTCGSGNLCYPTCADTINPSTGKSDCPDLKYLCNDSQYQALMKQQCPKTCGYCGDLNPNPGGSVCQDQVNPATGISNCPQDAYLCQNPAYKQLMKEQCPKTCGYCS